MSTIFLSVSAVGLSFHYFAQTPPDFLEIVAKISGVSAFDLRIQTQFFLEI